MTVQIPFQNDLNKGQSLLRDLAREMEKLQAAKRATKSRQSQWRKKETASPVGDSMSGVMFENMIVGMLFQSMFGLPIFEGLQLADETTRAFGFLGMAAHRDATENQAAPDEKELSAMISDVMLATQEAKFDAAADAQSRHEKELADIKQMLMAMMAMMLMQQRRSDKNADVVPDVLRAPDMARFKQNRHSLDCIRSQFAQQARVVAPALRCV